MTDVHFQPLDIHKVPLGGLTLIEASAGTGKTWTISGLYLRLLLERGLGVDRILVVTYTKAATAELQDRIRQQLANCLNASNAPQGAADGFCRDLLNALPPARRALAERRLIGALSALDQAAIHTIHGFCQRVLTESAFECGADFDCELLADDSELLGLMVDDFWRRELYAESGLWLDYLIHKGQTPDQWRREIAPHLGKPFLRLVPAAIPQDLSAIEEDHRAAFAAVGRLWRTQGAEAERLLLNFQGFNSRMYPREALPLWLESWRTFFSLAEPGLALPDKLDKLAPENLAQGTTKKHSPPSHPLFDACRLFLDRHRALVDGYGQRLVGLKLRLLGYCDAELPRHIRRRRLLSFSEMLNRLKEALDGESGESLAEAVRVRYPAALIDEFQDTDPVQYRIFQTLYGGRDLPAFLVGDPKQAIYHFRGADVFSYLRAHRDAAAHFTLETNYRSEPRLIDAVNRLFDSRRHPAPFLLDEIRYRGVKAADTRRSALDIEEESLEPFRFFLAPAAQDKSGEEVPLSKDKANAWSAEITAREIARLLNLAADGKARIVDPRGPRALHGGDIAVLVPSHRQGGLIERALWRYRVPSVRQSRQSVFETAEAHDLQRILWAVAEPSRAARLRAALLSDCLGLSGSELVALLEDEAAFENLMARFHRYHELWVKRGFMPMFQVWLEEERIADRLLEFEDGERRLTNLRHLAELLQAESRRHAALETLLGWYAAVLETPPRDSEDGLLRLESDARRVNIVTIHASKGLEFPIVFCPFVWDGRLWQSDEPAAFHDAHGVPTLDLGSPDFAAHRALAGREKLGEKLRQLYVALTRAEHRCYLVWGRIRDMETAALSWLLHGPETPVENPIDHLKTQLAGSPLAAIEDRVQSLTACSAGAMALCRAPPPTVLRSPPAAPEDLTVTAFDRPLLLPNWRMSSFTGLATGRHSEAPDHDLSFEPELTEEPGATLFAFPRGARAGSCLHAILEEWDFTCEDGDRLGDLVRRKLKAHGFEEHWTATVRRQLEAVLATPLDKAGLKLGAISPNRRLAEMEFTYSLKGGDARSLHRLLSDPGHSADPRFAEAARRLDFHQIEGYMKGYIDLVFESGGKYYLVDYKSTWLGNKYSDYAADPLAEAMAREHYYLQYLIYTVALHRYLTLRLPAYDYESHFGGVYYLFLRGMAPHRKTGIFWDRPKLGLVKALETRLGR